MAEIEDTIDMEAKTVGKRMLQQSFPIIMNLKQLIEQKKIVSIKDNPLMKRQKF